jgi:hypothetical protein
MESYEEKSLCLFRREEPQAIDGGLLDSNDTWTSRWIVKF